MEADSVEECLQGNSVVDPLVLEQTYDSALLAPEADAHEQPVLAQDAPAANPQPVSAATSSPEHVKNETSSIVDASTTGSLFSSGTIDLPSPELSQDLLTLLTAAPVLAGSVESDSRLTSVPPDVELLATLLVGVVLGSSC